MDVIPVIDLQHGLVVRGVAGRRAEYRPLTSTIVSSAEPGAVAEALVARFGFARAYVADLDAIAGAEPNWSAYRAIMAAGLELWIDAGAGDERRVRALADEAGVTGIVLGLESLPSPADLPKLIAAAGRARAIFSLDLLGNRPLTSISRWREAAPLEIALAAFESGADRLIVLDLAAVGVGAGPSTLPLIRELHAALPHASIIAGGGVRHVADLTAFQSAGATAVLVASALHDGRITREELLEFTFK
jgi:phosphoribosylformimino-5-aminoimidazole carboxamide ribotide isomerase